MKRERGGLTRGVSLAAEHSLLPMLRQSVEINSGTVLADEASYQIGSYLPKNAWRPLSGLETDLVSASSVELNATCVELLKVPDEICNLAAQVFGHIAELSSQEPVDLLPTFHTEHPKYPSLLNKIKLFAQKLGSLSQEPRILLGVPGRSTVAHHNGRLIGLHVDDWFDQTAEPRSSRPGRVVLNLGMESRKLLFINVPVDEITDELGMDQNMFQSDGTAIGRRFMQAYPTYPVLRLTVSPGMAYVAPTENIIHDGSLQGTRTPDIAAHVLGRFKDRPTLQY